MEGTADGEKGSAWTVAGACADEVVITALEAAYDVTFPDDGCVAVNESTETSIGGVDAKYDITGNICVCSDDKCNSAFGASGFAALVVAVLAALL